MKGETNNPLVNWLVFFFSQAEGETAVLVAGDPERAHMCKVEKDGGIQYHISFVEAMVSHIMLWWWAGGTVWELRKIGVEGLGS